MIFNFIALTPAIIISISILILYYNFPKKDEYLAKGKNAYKEALELIDMYENVLKPNLLNSNKELLRIINSELRECLSYINNNENKEFSEIIENKEIDENTENNIIKSFMDNLVKYYNEEELIISDSQKKLVK